MSLPEKKPRRSLSPWISDALLIYILLAGAFLRFSGLLWGEFQYLHPDERFLIWVGTDIQPVDSLGDYFNTPESTLNPHNTGHSFYVYGTLPMFITRYVVEAVFGHSGFNEMTQAGRALSSLADLLTILLVYMVAERLYDRRVAVLAAAFSAAAVLQIQQSHFFTMDTFMNMFSFLAFYFAVRVATLNGKHTNVQRTTYNVQTSAPKEENTLYAVRSTKNFFRHPLFGLSIGFGVALGMAVASKINAVPMAATLPLALVILLFKQPAHERSQKAVHYFLYLTLAGAFSLLAFRIFQPYAFSGPGFFGLKPNPLWVANIRELIAQSSADVDFPPAMQWARRQIWFSFQNLATWGLGLPLGLLSWAGFIWAGWRLLTGLRRYPGEWAQHALIWLWTAAYFGWQSLALNPTMRYQLPVYPTLVIFAAWFLVKLYDYGIWDKDSIQNTVDSRRGTGKGKRIGNIYRISAVVLGVVVLVGTYAYAFAFSQIYTRPITRVEASRWIYQNIPGPVNLLIQTPEGIYNQIISFPYEQTLHPGAPFNATFESKKSGILSQISLAHVLDETASHAVRTLEVSIAAADDPDKPIASATLSDDFSVVTEDINGESRGKSYVLDLDRPIQLVEKTMYILRIKVPGNSADAQKYEGTLSLRMLPSYEVTQDAINLSIEPSPITLFPGIPFTTDITPTVNGFLTSISLEGALQQDEIVSSANLPTVRMSLLMEGGETEPQNYDLLMLAQEQGYVMVVTDPIQVFSDVKYSLTLEILSPTGDISIRGMSVANEGEWDDGLPVRMEGYDAFGGIFPRDLNFNMYWDDNPEKVKRFINILNETDYIFISSNRQWGTLPRLPERFPMTTIYYRALLGCPETEDIVYCYRVAQPGMYQGELGFDLVKVFESPPSLGPIRLNDQFAEEAFTVYDHPKVLIFQKRADYDVLKTRTILNTANFDMQERIAPMRAPAHPTNLLLPDDRQAVQQQGGTWSELFNTEALQNRIQPLGILLWYLCVSLLGLLTYPLLRLALPGLEDGGYPLARIAGMLLLSYLVWMAGSFDIPFSRLTISAGMLMILGFSLLAGYRQFDLLRQEWRQRRNYFLIIEGLMLAFFIVFLLIRLGNPDLWHPWKGGEKPMDFSYFNAVLKSTTFPPYDPWFAGGYLNYYYYGFVVVGVLVKWLGLTPAFAYNLILPTLFSMIAMGAFSVAWNITHVVSRSVRGTKYEEGLQETIDTVQRTTYSVPRVPLVAACASALGVAVLGNLGTVRMIFQGWQKLAAPGGTIEGAGLLTRWVWAARGLVMNVGGERLPYGIGDWYWIPSRAIPAPNDVEPITEFPFFTVLYADLHAHLMGLPIMLLALACILSIVFSQGRWKSWSGGVLGFFFTGLAVGALRPTNTWYFYPYLALGVVALAYTLGMYYQIPKMPRDLPFLDFIFANKNIFNISPPARPNKLKRLLIRFLNFIYRKSFKIVVLLGAILLFVGLSFAQFEPFSQWYALGYDEVRAWDGTHTTLTAYLTHWGLFLFLIVSWMAWESIDWMANTPVSSLRKLQQQWGMLLIWAAFVLLLSLVVLLTIPQAAFSEVKVGAPIAWFVLPLAAWAGVLILRPGQPDAKRAVLFMVGTGLVMTLTVELIVLVGDIGRMNTVFKFYLQVWVLFGVSAAAALGWLLPEIPKWSAKLRWGWQIILAMLVFGASMYTLIATSFKIDDRIAEDVPLTLDGMEFMLYSTYNDNWGTMLLSQDYEAIRWMQENVIGSPVIVEANLRNLYRWGSRYSIYTGLPGVVGWEWHQQQQRAINPGTWVSSRIQEIELFYLTLDLEDSVEFLRKYDVQYIILGQQERGMYAGPGLEKFADANGLFWREVFRTAETVIYEVTLP